MSEQETLAQFTVRITSAKHASWQGVVQAEDAVFYFESEMQLIGWLLRRYPALLPNPPRFTD